jgi:hypothetical protein
MKYKYNAHGRQLSRPCCQPAIAVAIIPKFMTINSAYNIEKGLEGKTQRSNPISPELMRWLNGRDQALGMGKP